METCPFDTIPHKNMSAQKQIRPILKCPSYEFHPSILYAALALFMTSAFCYWFVKYKCRYFIRIYLLSVFLGFLLMRSEYSACIIKGILRDAGYEYITRSYDIYWVHLATLILLMFIRYRWISLSVFLGFLLMRSEYSACMIKGILRDAGYEHVTRSYNIYWVHLATLILLMCIRYRWISPVNRTKCLEDTGFDHLFPEAKRRKTHGKKFAREMVENKDIGQLPPVFPNGWVPIAESRRVKVGSTFTVAAIGYKFCVFRGTSGKAFVLNAVCPHLGADLSAGGRVVGDCVECPFHKWVFKGEDGQCVRIPYSEKIPAMAETKSWTSCERNGYIFVWHHAENEPPSWDVPTVSEIEDGTWVYRGRSEYVVACHIQEIPENGADVAHLDPLHSSFALEGSEVLRRCYFPLWRVIRHEWQPSWEPDEDVRHLAHIKLKTCIWLWRIRIPFSLVDLNITQIGPAIVHIYMNSSFGSGIFLQHIIPEGPICQRLVYHIYTEPSFKQFPANLLLMGECMMVERDIGIWNNKTFLRKPILVKEDSLINRFRRWYSQFYSEHSPTIKNIRERSLEW